MTDAVHRAQQDYFRRMLHKRRGYQVSGERNGQRRAMDAKDQQRRDAYEDMIAALLEQDAALDHPTPPVPPSARSDTE